MSPQNPEITVLRHLLATCEQIRRRADHATALAALRQEAKFSAALQRLEASTARNHEEPAAALEA